MPPAIPSRVFNDADQASAEVMLKAFLEIGLPTVSPLRPVFINHTRHLLAMDPILPADRCVIEVLEDVTADPQTLDALRRLKSLNFRIALDDFVYSDGPRPHDRTRRFCKARSSGARTRALSGTLSRCCAPSTFELVAEKIESEAEFRWCRKLGCGLFQGYYLRRPEILSGRRIPSNRLSVLSLLSECANLENSAGTIAAAVSRDAPLTYSLLRLANSALYRRRSEIRSPAQAVMMLGMDFVSRWATLLALSAQ